MTIRLARVAVLALMLSAVPVWPAPARAAPYGFDVLAERPAWSIPSYPPYPYAWVPALNDNGVAAFVLPPEAGQTGEAIYTGTPGNVRRVQTPGVWVGGGVSINNPGRIGFIGIATGRVDTGIFAVSAGGPVVPITGDGNFGGFNPNASGVMETAISDSGAVLALEDTPQRFPSYAVIGDGSGPAQVVFRTSPPEPSRSGVITLSSPRMSAGGDWVAYESNWNGSPLYVALHTNYGSRYVLYGIGITTGFSTLGPADVAGDGVLLFAASGYTSPHQLYTSTRGGPPVPVPGSAGMNESVVAINDLGDIAELSSNIGERRWQLRLLRGGVLETVLAEGDPFLGSTVSRIGFDPKGFNNADQFALLVALADGRDVYVLASPVPEPGAVALLLAGAGAVLVRRRGGGVS